MYLILEGLESPENREARFSMGCGGWEHPLGNVVMDARRIEMGKCWMADLEGRNDCTVKN